MIQMKMCRRHGQVSCGEHQGQKGLLPSLLFETQGQNAMQESHTNIEQPSRAKRVGHVVR